MTLERIDLQLPGPLLAQARALARDLDVTMGHLMRAALEREVQNARPKTHNCADEALVARLQRLLAADMASAQSWHQLEAVLKRRGYTLRPAGGGLTLHDAHGTRLCKSSEIGFGYARLVKRFGAPMPGHPHQMSHLLSGPATVEEPDDFDVIEPF